MASPIAKHTSRRPTTLSASELETMDALRRASNHLSPGQICLLGHFSCYEAFIHIIDSMFNQHAKWLKVCKPIPWRRWIDTSLTAPEDACDWETAPTVAAPSYLVQPRSLVLLFEHEVH